MYDMSDVGKNQKRLRLYGKSATEEDIAREIARLLLGDNARGIEPKTKKQVMQAVGFTSRDSFYRYKKIAMKLNLFEEDKDGNIILPKRSEAQKFEKFSKENSIVNHPLIKDWVQNMQTRKQGKPIQQWHIRLVHFTSWLNTLKVNPEAVLVTLEATDKLHENFLLLYKEGKADVEYTAKTLNYIKFGRTDRIKIDQIAYSYSQAYRDFMNYHRMPYPKNWGGVSSQKVVGHGNYADVKLSDEELKFCDTWIRTKFGRDSMEFLLFWIGLESCARNTALFNMPLVWNVIENQEENKTAYVLEVYESKTKQKKGGKWKKFISLSETQIALEWAKKQGHKFLWNGFSNKLASNKHHSDWLKEMFIELGKDQIHKSHPEDEQGYFITHTIHVFRHAGAHYWLRKTNYNYNVVKKVGGWWTTKELEDSYGEMPEEILFEAILGKGKITSIVTGLEEE